MKIWKLNNKNNYECIKTITFENQMSRCDILRLNENEFVTSIENDKCIKFWNTNDYSNIININNIECPHILKYMCLIEDIMCWRG